MNLISTLNISIVKVKFGYILFFLFFLDALSMKSQDNSQKIRRFQRAIYIFNFAEQITWPNLDLDETFNIGVLGNDVITVGLEAISAKRKIKNKTVVVRNFENINDVQNIHLLYVNNSFNYDIQGVLHAIQGKNILLITEEYEYNVSMINMMNVANTFEYEINTGLILNAGLRFSTSLKKNAVLSPQKWKELYLVSEKSLTNEKKQNKEQKELIKIEQLKVKSQEVKIDTFVKKINVQQKWISNLNQLNNLQQKKYDEKVKLERDLEKIIQANANTITQQNKQLIDTKAKIDSQQQHLIDLGNQITLKNTILKQKEKDVAFYKKINWLTLAIAILILIIGVLIFINYRAKLKLTKELEQKNESIIKQSKSLEFKNQELEQFAYITSHDLKEPLATISGLIFIFTQEHKDMLGESGKKMLQYMDDTSKRMKNLIVSLLEYSKLGRSEEITDINTEVLVESIKSDLQSSISRTEATITQSNMPIIKGTEFEIRLLFQNLISNSIKFMPRNTKPIISISCEKVPDKSNQNQGFYRFSVKDNGIGIDPKYKEKIFIIFKRLHSENVYEGTGIGLAHCKKIVEAHDGTIWLESEVGMGTTFFFTIPFAV